MPAGPYLESNVMPEIVVAAQSRTETGKNANRRLRQRGLIPAVFYGGKQQVVQVAVSPKELIVVLRSPAGTSTLFDLDLEGTRRKVILKEFQAEPVRGELLHADFYEVALDKPIEVKVHVELEGVPVGVKTEGGFLDFITRELDIECLPLDIPAKVVVDVSPLQIGKHLRVSDLPPIPKVKVLTDADVVIAHVVVRREEEVAPAVEAVVEGEAAAAAPGEPEVAKKGKGEEPAAAAKGKAEPEVIKRGKAEEGAGGKAEKKK
jgi:large subunit ribosomal protein L25